MKLAVLSDIHANLYALEAVVDDIQRWGADIVVVNGDVVNRGPHSSECLALVQRLRREAGWLVVQGNHEKYMLRHVGTPPPDVSDINENINQLSYWTYLQMGKQLDDIDAWPLQLNLKAPDGSDVLITHGSPRGQREGLYPFVPLANIQPRLGSNPPPLLVAGHIHMGFVRKVDETIVVNSGSAGQLCFGDTRANYARIEWRGGGWRPTIHFVPYDIVATDRDYHACGFLEEGGVLNHLIYHEWRTADALLYQWLLTEKPRVVAGDVELSQSVFGYLERLGVVAAC